MTDDGYNIEEDSDSDDGMGWESPEEDEELILSDILDDKPKSIDKEDEEVDFELEMQRELDAAIRLQSDQQQGCSPSTSKEYSSKSNQVEDESTTKEEVYHEDYFSSGSEDGDLVGGVPSKSKQRRKVLTNEELFYDPDMDDNDEKWVTNQRQMNSAIGKTKKNKAQSNVKSKPDVSKVPSSDAILSCPACLTMLCIDCQRHETYKNQYRAMFVMNCKVVKDEILRYKEQRHKHIGKRKGKQKGKLVAEAMETVKNLTQDGEIYHPVQCNECGTEVAVFDCDEVYHFFDVLTSYA